MVKQKKYTVFIDYESYMVDVEAASREEAFTKAEKMLEESEFKPQQCGWDTWEHERENNRTPP